MLYLLNNVLLMCRTNQTKQYTQCHILVKINKFSGVGGVTDNIPVFINEKVHVLLQFNPEIHPNQNLK